MPDFIPPDEHWINKHWRPMVGWAYLVTCTFDFIIAPIAWSMLQSLMKGNVTIQWQPITLQGAGLYHMAMGAVMGITSYGRTQEKLNGATRPYTGSRQISESRLAGPPDTTPPVL